MKSNVAGGAWVTAKQFCERVGMSPKTFHDYRRLGLMPGWRIAKSKGRHRGRECFYSCAQVEAAYRRIQSDLKAGKTLDQQAKEHGWYMHGFEGQTEEPIRDAVRRCGRSLPKEVENSLVEMIGVIWASGTGGNWRIIRDRRGRLFVQYRRGGEPARFMDVVKQAVTAAIERGLEAAIGMAVVRERLRHVGSLHRTDEPDWQVLGDLLGMGLESEFVEVDEGVGG